jgi:hypothetical protein
MRKRGIGDSLKVLVYEVLKVLVYEALRKRIGDSNLGSRVLPASMKHSSCPPFYLPTKNPPPPAPLALYITITLRCPPLHHVALAPGHGARAKWPSYNSALRTYAHGPHTLVP